MVLVNTFPDSGMNFNLHSGALWRRLTLNGLLPIEEMENCSLTSLWRKVIPSALPFGEHHYEIESYLENIG